jgi:hypothetical protein
MAEQRQDTLHLCSSAMSDTSSSYSEGFSSDSSYDETIDPHWTTFTQMTSLVDLLLATYFRTFMKELSNVSPPLTGIDFARLHGIARVISQYERSAALDERGSMPFRLVAEPQEAWIVELLVCLSMGRRIYCGYEHVSKNVDDHLVFLWKLQERIGPCQDRS